MPLHQWQKEGNFILFARDPLRKLVQQDPQVSVFQVSVFTLTQPVLRFLLCRLHNAAIQI